MIRIPMDEKRPSDTPHVIFVYWGQLSMENVSPSKQGRWSTFREDCTASPCFLTKTLTNQCLARHLRWWVQKQWLGVADSLGFLKNSWKTLIVRIDGHDKKCLDPVQKTADQRDVSYSQVPSGYVKIVIENGH